MDRFVKPVKSTSSTVKAKSSGVRSHPYKSQEDLIKEKCCIPRVGTGNIFLSSCTGHQVAQGPGKATSHFTSRNAKLARQLKQKTLTSTPIVPSSTDNSGDSDQVSEATEGEGPCCEGKIFRNCSIYVNGYMGTRISDIELKRKLVQNGARVVFNFGRKSVTHVILGANGLAGGKIQKEMESRKNGVKYVTVDWYFFLRVGC